MLRISSGGPPNFKCSIVKHRRFAYFRLHESDATDVSTCKTVQVMAAARGQNNDLFGVVLDLSNLPAYRIGELKFWLKCQGDSLKRLPTKATCIQR